MKTCPHCQFLVVDDATSCGVCKQPLAVPRQPSGPWGAEPVPGFGETPPLPGAGAPQSGSGFIAPAPRSGSGGAKVAIIVVGCLAVVGLLVVGAVTFVGQTVEKQALDRPDNWTVHRDPAGRFQVELPGAPIKNTRSDPMPDGGAVTVDALDVARGPWNAVMYVIDVPEGAGLDVPLALMEEDLEQTITSGVPNSGYTVVSSSPADTPAGPVLDIRFTLRSEGVECIGLAHYAKVGADPYGVVMIGPAAQEDEVRSMQERMVASLQVPPAP